jgi:hypothetical protein
VHIGDDVLNAQFGCLNFHVKRYKDSDSKLILAVKEKWSSGWVKAWFYCKIPIHQNLHGGKSVHALRSNIGMLDYLNRASS